MINYHELRQQKKNNEEVVNRIGGFAIAIVAGIILWSIIFFCVYPYVKAEEIPEKRAVLAIIGEAENQGDEGMMAVACAIRERGTLKGVYGEHAPRVKRHKYSQMTYVSAKTAWELSGSREEGDYCAPFKDANSWENTKAFGKPYWANSCTEIITVKDHTFYKCLN